MSFCGSPSNRKILTTSCNRQQPSRSHIHPDRAQPLPPGEFFRHKIQGDNCAAIVLATSPQPTSRGNAPNRSHGDPVKWFWKSNTLRGSICKSDDPVTPSFDTSHTRIIGSSPSETALGLPALENAQLETLVYEGRAPFIEMEVIVSSGYRIELL